MRHSHSEFHNVKSLNELFANNLVINPQDAEKLGLQQEETVLVSSHHGKILRRVNINPRIMLGVVMLGQGNWTNLDENNIDRGAAANTLSGPILVGEGHSPWNTCLVKIEKWTGTPLVPDYKRPQRII
jgi:anaerobic dimethyl sulfoxide reductase subunit A